MRTALLFSVALATTLGAHPATASSPQAELSGTASPVAASGFEHYRGYAFDLSESNDRKDAPAMADGLKRQLDMVESAGFSPKVLRFFHSVPIVASEMACLEEDAAVACYGLTVPEREHR